VLKKGCKIGHFIGQVVVVVVVVVVVIYQ